MSFGGGMFPPTPPAVKKLLWINVGIWLVFALAFAAGISPLISLFRWLSMTPTDVVRGESAIADIFEVPDGPGLTDHEGDRLAGIQPAAAAKGDHAVVAALLEAGDPVGDGNRDVLDHRITVSRARRQLLDCS